MNENPFTPPASTAVLVPHPSGLTAEERNWGMIAHFSGLAGLVTGGLGNVIGPLVVWLMKKDTMPFVAQEAKEALNFHITAMIFALGLGAVSIPLMFIFVGFITLMIAFAVPLIALALSIYAGMQAAEGRSYRYPFTIRFVK